MDRKYPGDLKTEVHFIGQITGGSEFGIDHGLFCEAELDYGQAWRELPDKMKTSIQTQTSYAAEDEYFVWAHPIDLFLATDSIFGWPRLIFRVWRLDDVGRIDLLSYGVTSLPCTSGYFEINCPTWRPFGSWKDEAMAFFIGGAPRLTSQDAISRDVDKRGLLRTISSGTVHLELNVILRNFDRHNVGNVF